MKTQETLDTVLLLYAGKEGPKKMPRTALSKGVQNEKQKALTGRFGATPCL